MQEGTQPTIKCRICGSHELNKQHYTLDQLCDRIGVHQLLERNESLNRLVRPCECRGDFAFAHKVCLENWIETTKHRYCDVCRFKYNVIVINQTFFDWISGTRETEKLLKVIAVALVVYYLSALGIMKSRESKNRDALDVFVYSTACIWFFFCSAGLLVYIVLAFLRFREWKHSNLSVVVDENKSPQLDTQVLSEDVLKSSGYRRRDKS